jgi:hypothetical protein
MNFFLYVSINEIIIRILVFDTHPTLFAVAVSTEILHFALLPLYFFCTAVSITLSASTNTTTAYYPSFDHEQSPGLC